MSNLSTLDAGIDLVTTVDHPSGGLVIDSWHVSRSGTPYAALASKIPLAKVFVVELADAAIEVTGDLWTDATNHRMAPGCGELGMSEFVVAMHRVGWSGTWGVEIISAALRATPIPEGVRHVYDSTAAVLDAAQAELGQLA